MHFLFPPRQEESKSFLNFFSVPHKPVIEKEPPFPFNYLPTEKAQLITTLALGVLTFALVSAAVWKKLFVSVKVNKSEDKVISYCPTNRLSLRKKESVKINKSDCLANRLSLLPKEKEDGLEKKGLFTAPNESSARELLSTQPPSACCIFIKTKSKKFFIKILSQNGQTQEIMWVPSHDQIQPEIQRLKKDFEEKYDYFERLKKSPPDRVYAADTYEEAKGIWQREKKPGILVYKSTRCPAGFSIISLQSNKKIRFYKGKEDLEEQILLLQEQILNQEKIGLWTTPNENIAKLLLKQQPDFHCCIVERSSDEEGEPSIIVLAGQGENKLCVPLEETTPQDKIKEMQKTFEEKWQYFEELKKGVMNGVYAADAQEEASSLWRRNGEKGIYIHRTASPPGTFRIVSTTGATGIGFLQTKEDMQKRILRLNGEEKGKTINPIRRQSTEKPPQGFAKKDLNDLPAELKFAPEQILPSPIEPRPGQNVQQIPLALSTEYARHLASILPDPALNEQDGLEAIPTVAFTRDLMTKFIREASLSEEDKEMMSAIRDRVQEQYIRFSGPQLHIKEKISQHHTVEEALNKLAAEILQDAEEKAAFLERFPVGVLLAVGWTQKGEGMSIGGHFISVELRKTPEGKFIFDVGNAGSGVHFHEGWDRRSRKAIPIKTYQTHYKEALVIVKDLLLLRAKLHEKDETPAEKFYKIFRHAEQIKNLNRIPPRPCQKIGNCALRSQNESFYYILQRAGKVALANHYQKFIEELVKHKAQKKPTLRDRIKEVQNKPPILPLMT